MPGIAALCAERAKVFEKFIQGIDVEGLIRLTEKEEYTIGKIYSLPNELWQGEKYWENMETIWLPRTLVRADGQPAEIITAFSPIIRYMPLGKDETGEGMIQRISEDTHRLANEVSEQTKGHVNAFHLGEFDIGYVVGEPSRQARALFGEDSVNSITQLERRAVFLTSLYEVRE